MDKPSKTPKGNFAYLKPGGANLEVHPLAQPPPIPEGCIRVVCISDTHNETKHLHLPWGHLLVHAGDVLTESGLRHVEASQDSCFVKVKQYGAGLLDKFAQWLGSQPHPHKLVVAGNHDWVLQALGTEGVTQVMEQYCAAGSFIYLEHEEANVGPLKVFGSPYGYWGSHNNAYMSSTLTYDAVAKGTHVVVTHYPAILPKRGGRLKEDKDIVGALERAGSLLHVGGHCHWAHGCYLSSKKQIPCVVASVCSSDWINPVSLAFVGSDRGDVEGDRWRGGYNLQYAPIVCDILVPEGIPKETDKWIRNPKREIVQLTAPFVNPHIVKTKPTLLFFGPNTDPGAVKRLLPKFEEYFDTLHFDDVQEAITETKALKVPFVVCVAKLGSSKNSAYDLLQVIREATPKTVIYIHSTTAMSHKGTQDILQREIGGIAGFFDRGNESKMLKELENIAASWHVRNL